MKCNQCGAKSTSEDPIDCPQCKCISRQEKTIINLTAERDKLQEEYDSAFCGLLGASRAECIEFGRSQRRVHLAFVHDGNDSFDVAGVFSTQRETNEFLDELKDGGCQEMWELGKNVQCDIEKQLMRVSYDGTIIDVHGDNIVVAYETEDDIVEHVYDRKQFLVPIEEETRIRIEIVMSERILPEKEEDELLDLRSHRNTIKGPHTF